MVSSPNFIGNALGLFRDRAGVSALLALGVLTLLGEVIHFWWAWTEPITILQVGTIDDPDPPWAYEPTRERLQGWVSKAWCGEGGTFRCELDTNSIRIETGLWKDAAQKQLQIQLNEWENTDPHSGIEIVANENNTYLEVRFPESPSSHLTPEAVITKLRELPFAVVEEQSPALTGDDSQKAEPTSREIRGAGRYIANISPEPKRMSDKPSWWRDCVIDRTRLSPVRGKLSSFLANWGAPREVTHLGADPTCLQGLPKLAGQLTQALEAGEVHLVRRVPPEGVPRLVEGTDWSSEVDSERSALIAVLRPAWVDQNPLLASTLRKSLRCRAITDFSMSGLGLFPILSPLPFRYSQFGPPDWPNCQDPTQTRPAGEGSPTLIRVLTHTRWGKVAEALAEEGVVEVGGQVATFAATTVDVVDERRIREEGAYEVSILAYGVPPDEVDPLPTLIRLLPVWFPTATVGTCENLSYLIESGEALDSTTIYAQVHCAEQEGNPEQIDHLLDRLAAYIVPIGAPVTGTLRSKRLEGWDANTAQLIPDNARLRLNNWVLHLGLAGLGVSLLMGGGAREWTLRAADKKIQRQAQLLANIEGLHHDLMGPLASVRSWARISRGKSIDPHVHRAMNTIERESVALAALVDSIRWLVRAQSGAVVLAPANEMKPKIATIWETAVVSLRNQAQLIDPAPQIQVEGQIPYQLSTTMSEVALARVVENILSNALKYRKGDSVTVTAKVEIQSTLRGNPVAILCISDEGIGIPAEFRAKLFEFRARADNVSNLPGEGVGLFSCKRIMLAAGGGIDLGSELQPTTFILRIPLERDPSQNDRT